MYTIKNCLCSLNFFASLLEIQKLNQKEKNTIISNHSQIQNKKMKSAAIISALLAASAQANGEKLTLRKLSSENRWSNFKSSFAKIYGKSSKIFFSLSNYHMFVPLKIAKKKSRE